MIVRILSLAVLAVVLALSPAAPAAAAPCDPPIANEIACENSKPGNPASEWDVSGSGDADIQGFATDISVDQGQTVQFKIDSVTSLYRLDIYRMGYYGGTGARRVRHGTPARWRVPAAGLPEPSGHRAGRLRQLVGVGLVGGAGRRGVGHLLRAARARGRHRRRSHVIFVVRDDDGALRPPVPDLGHHLAGLQPLRRQQPLHRLARRARLQGQLQPPLHDARLRARGLGLQRRVPDGALARAQRLRRQLLHRRGQPAPRRRAAGARDASCRSATTSTGRADSAPTSRPPAPPA